LRIRLRLTRFDKFLLQILPYFYRGREALQGYELGFGVASHFAVEAEGASSSELLCVWRGRLARCRRLETGFAVEKLGPNTLR
jgi:hypothetical protein